MCFDTIVSLYIDGSGFEIGFHDSKVFFDFPTLLVNLNDFRWVIFKVCYNSIKTIIHCFFANAFFVQFINRFICDFTIWCNASLLNESCRVVLILPSSAFS